MKEQAISIYVRDEAKAKAKFDAIVKAATAEYKAVAGKANTIHEAKVKPAQAVINT